MVLKNVKVKSLNFLILVLPLGSFSKDYPVTFTRNSNTTIERKLLNFLTKKVLAELQLKWKFKSVFFCYTVCLQPSGWCSYAISCLRESDGYWTYLNLTLWHDGKIYPNTTKYTQRGTHKSRTQKKLILFISFPLIFTLMLQFLFKGEKPLWHRMQKRSSLRR